MKIAIILNGVMRYLEPTSSVIKLSLDDYIRVVDSLNESFKGYDVDIYYHTWNSATEYIYNQDEWNEKLRVKENIVKIIFEDQLTYNDVCQLPKNSYSLSQRNNYSCMSIYNCFKALRTLVDAVKESGRSYDYILRIRNDVIFKTNVERMMHEAEGGKLCVPDVYGNMYGPNDHMLFSRAEHQLRVFDKTLEEIKAIVGCSHDQEHVTYKIVTECGRYEVHKFHVSVYEILREVYGRK